MILVNTGPTTLTKTWYVDGVATDVGTVTIGIVDADGNTVVASGTAVTDGGDGTYSYSLAVQTEVKQLIVTWTENAGAALTDYIEVVGGWLFTIDDLRTFHQSDLSNTSTYPTADLAETRARITDEFEKICGVSFVPRYGRKVTSGDGSNVLWIDAPMLDSVLSCTIGGTTVAASNFDVDPLLPIIRRTNGTFTKPLSSDPYNVIVSYKHGHQTVPPDIRRAALTLAHTQLIADIQGTGVPAYASSWTDPSGTYQAFAANSNSGRWYGMPQVDNVLRRYNLNVPVI